MNIQMRLLTEELSSFAFPFPSPTSPQNEKAMAIWEKILCHGEGFDPQNTAVLKEPLKLYLKEKSECGGNIICFFDQFWVTVKPKLGNEINNATIERLFTILKCLSEEYIQNDTCGLGFSFPIVGKKWESLNIKTPQSFLDYTAVIVQMTVAIWAEAVDLMTFFLKNFFVPSPLFAVSRAISCYRTTRQCSIGIGSFAAKLKEHDPSSLETINSAYKKCVEGMKASPTTYIDRDVGIERDESKNISEIKDLQSLRIASTFVRVVWVALIFFLHTKGIIALAPFVYWKDMFLIVTISVAILSGIFGFIESRVEGTLKHCLRSSAMFLVTMSSISEGIINLYVGCSSMFLASEPITFVILNHTLSTIGGLFFILLGLACNVFDSETQKSKFYGSNLEHDTISFLLKPMGWGIKKSLDLSLFLIDGPDPKIT